MNQRAFRFFLFASPISACLVLLGPRLWRLAGESALPQWDMAKYGVSGLRLAGALATLDLPLFLRELNSLSVWPPLFPLLEAPAFLLFGPEPSVASRLVALLFLASLALLPWALSPLAEGGSPAPGLLVAAALAATPFWGAFASLVMLEVPGLLLLVLALGFTLRAIRGEPGAWPAAYLCSTLLFFCKYNYGLLFIVPLLLFQSAPHAGWVVLVVDLFAAPPVALPDPFAVGNPVSCSSRRPCLVAVVRRFCARTRGPGFAGSQPWQSASGRTLARFAGGPRFRRASSQLLAPAPPLRLRASRAGPLAFGAHLFVVPPAPASQGLSGIRREPVVAAAVFFGREPAFLPAGFFRAAVAGAARGRCCFGVGFLGSPPATGVDGPVVFGLVGADRLRERFSSIPTSRTVFSPMPRFRCWFWPPRFSPRASNGFPGVCGGCRSRAMPSRFWWWWRRRWAVGEKTGSAC